MRRRRPSSTLGSMDKPEAPVEYADTATRSGRSGPRFARLRRILRWVGRVVVVLLFLIAVIIGFATSESDVAKIVQFVESVDHWQSNTEFRQVAYQYVTRGSDAMGTTPMGMTSARWIVNIRSLPGLPKEFALNDTSRAHYENLSKGSRRQLMIQPAEGKIGRAPVSTPGTVKPRMPSSARNKKKH